MVPQRPNQPTTRPTESASVEMPNDILTAMAGVRAWSVLWEAFRADQSDWWHRVASNEPVYLLPRPIIDGLGPPGPQDHVGRRVFLSAQDANAEAAFTALCQSYSTGCVGVWLDRPIDFPAAQQRYGSPRGIVTRLIEIVAEVFGVSADRVWQLHQRCCSIRRLL